jgi:4-amino-4-deoxy-L-arabinose transferase-like glycosyltransferase
MASVPPVVRVAIPGLRAWLPPIRFLRVVLDSQNVDTPAENSHHPSETSLIAKIGWAALIAATLYVCYFSHLGAIGFVGPDEPRYAWIARDMMETGDWVTPRLYGKPWFEKPPLLYWGAGLCFKWFGVSEAAARLPSALSALLATLALAWLALRLYGAETARWLLLLLPTTVGMIGFSHAAATDMPFSGMLTIAMVCAAVILGLTRNEYTPILPRTPWLALLLFGFLLGLAVLAKGPAAIILSGGAVFFWAFFTKRWRDAFRLFHPVAVASFLLTALPWYVICARRNPDFLRVFIIEHNFKRFLTPEFQHIRPFWFYFPIILIAFVPWTLLLLSPLNDLIRTGKTRSWSTSPNLLLCCWAAFTLIFFSISKSKLPGYILPAVPPLALLLSQAVLMRTRKILPGARWVGVASGLAIVGAIFIIDRLPYAIDYFPPGPLFWVEPLSFIAAIIAVILGFRRYASQALIVAILSVILVLSVGLTGDARWALDSGLSARWASGRPEGISPEYWSTHTATYKLQRSFHYALNFYLHKELGEWSGNTVERNWVFTDSREINTLMSLGLDCSHFMAYPSVIVCEAAHSVDRLGNGEGRQAQQEK